MPFSYNLMFFMNIRQTDELSSKHANAVVCFVVRGFDDLLIPLRDVSTLDVPAATFGHSVKVTYSQSVSQEFVHKDKQKHK